MGKIDKIDSLQINDLNNDILEDPHLLPKNEFVRFVVETNSKHVYGITQGIGNQYFGLSPLKCYQTETGLFMQKKEYQYDYINKYRKNSYNYLLKMYGKQWVDNFFSIIHSSFTVDTLNEFLERHSDLLTVQMAKTMAILESNLIGKGYIYESYYDYLLHPGLSDETYKVMGYLSYENEDYEYGYQCLTKIRGTESLNNDRELLSFFISLCKDDNQNKLVLDQGSIMFNLIENLKKSGQIEPEEAKVEKSVLYSHFLEIYLADNDAKHLVEFGIDSVNNGDYKSNFHIIQGHLLQGNYEKASYHYNKIRKYKNGEKVFFTKDNYKLLKEFYVYGISLGVMGVQNLYVDYSRKQFELNGFNQENFDEIMYIAGNGLYTFTPKDNIFFEEFDKNFSSTDNDDDIVYTIEILVNKYIDRSYAIYLEKILFICSKYLRGKYKDSYKVLSTLVYWLEYMDMHNSFLDKYGKDLISFDGFEEGELYDLYVNKINKDLAEKLKKDTSVEYLEACLNDLLSKFCVSVLDEIDETYKRYDINILLASIFDKLGMHEQSKIVMKNDEFFKRCKDGNYLPSLSLFG